MNKYFLYILILPALFSSSCIRDIEIDLPEHEPVLVVNSLFTPDSVWRVALSHSIGALEDDSLARPVLNGFVELRINNVPADTLVHSGEGIYLSDLEPLPGLNYSLHGTAPGYNAVSAEAVLPSAISIQSWSLKDSVKVDEFGFVLGELKFSIQDPAAEKNYYKVAIATFDTLVDLGDTLIQLYPFYFLSDDPLLDNFGGDGAVFPDNVFNGQLKEFTINLSQIDLDFSGDIYIILQSMPYETYRYQTTYYDNTYGAGNPFKEPTPVASNITGGLGIFGGWTSSTIRIR